MRAFRYRLSALLTRAEHHERLIQAHLVRLEQELGQASRRLSALRDLQAQMRSRLRGVLAEDLPRSGRGIGISQLEAARSDLERTEELLTRAGALCHQLQARMVATRQRLLEASRARRVLENHRAELSQRHRRGELAAETKHLDELAGGGRSSRSRQRVGLEPSPPTSGAASD
jgi:flagellar biosynthesis chaperone FliJ